MAKKVEVYRDFSAGAVASIPFDKLPPTAFPRAFNTHFRATAGGGVAVGIRPGLRWVGQPSTGSTYVCGMAPFISFDGATRYESIIDVTADGKIWNTVSGVSDSQLTVPTPDFVSSTLSGTKWQFQTAKNMLFAVSGSSQLKVYRMTGTPYVAPFGVKRPTNAPSQNTLGAGNMTGTYDFRVTWYNADTGTESSASDSLSVTLASNNIIVNRNNSTVPFGVTHWRLWVRKQAVQKYFYRSAAMEYTTATTSATVNTTDADLNLMTLKAPDTAENEPPPAGLVDICWHISRMFATDGEKVYYSKEGNPEQFDPDNWEYVGQNDGQRITAIIPLTEDMLAVFKERSIYAIVGDNPQSWTIQLVTSSYGSLSHNVVEGDGVIAFWSAAGPCIWSKSGEPELIANETIQPLVRQGVLNASSVDGEYHIAFDPNEHYFLFALPCTGEASEWTAAPYSILHKAWEATAWDLPPIKCMSQIPSATGEWRIHFATTDRLIYEVARDVKTDAAANTTGTDLFFPITGATSNTVTFTYGGAIPKNSRASTCKVIDLATLRVHRSLYTSAVNAGVTTVTLTTAFTSVPTSGIIVFDLPIMEFDTKTTLFEFTKRRLLHAYLEMNTEGDVPAALALYRDSETSPLSLWTPTLDQNANPEFGTSGPAITGAIPRFKRRIGATCRSWWMRFVGWYPLTNWSLTGLGATSAERTDEW